jgi:hypothetical protein
MSRLRAPERPSPGAMSAHRGRSASGQATVELVAMLPLAALVVAAVAAVLAAGAASEQAGAAAEAGAAALLQDADADAAAKRALGTDAIARARIEVQDRRVTVEVRPGGMPAPLARLLSATASAHAGPGPAADAATVVVRGGDGESARPGDGRDDAPSGGGR